MKEKTLSFIPHLRKMQSVVAKLKRIDEDENFSDIIINTIYQIIDTTTRITNIGQNSVEKLRYDYYVVAFLFGTLAGLLQIDSSLTRNFPKNIIIINKDDKVTEIEISTYSLILRFMEAVEELLDYDDFRNQNRISDATALSEILRNIEILSDFLSQFNVNDSELCKISWKIQAIFAQGNEIIANDEEKYELSMKLEFALGELAGMFLAKHVMPQKLIIELNKLTNALLQI